MPEPTGSFRVTTEHDLASENAALRQENERLRERLAEMTDAAEALRHWATRQPNTSYQQIRVWSEKIAALATQDTPNE